MKATHLAVLVTGILVVGACGASSQPTSRPATDPPTVSPAPTASAPGITPSDATVEVTVGTDSGAELKFDPGEVTVRAGEVRLTFENRSTLPHNLTFQGPISVATSTVVAPGTSETLSFTAPDPGEYPFVCTLHPGMGGTLIAEGA
jgi:plastocyanin